VRGQLGLCRGYMTDLDLQGCCHVSALVCAALFTGVPDEARVPGANSLSDFESWQHLGVSRFAVRYSIIIIFIYANI